MRDRGTASGYGRATTLIALGRLALCASRLDRQLPAELTAARSARRHVREVLGDLLEDDLIATAELVVTELVANAVAVSEAHAGIKLSVWPVEAGLQIEVLDHSAQVPQCRRACESDEDGRGLLLVAELADDWGWRWVPDGKVVWARLGHSIGPSPKQLTDTVAGFLGGIKVLTRNR